MYNYNRDKELGEKILVLLSTKANPLKNGGVSKVARITCDIETLKLILDKN